MTTPTSFAIERAKTHLMGTLAFSARLALSVGAYLAVAFAIGKEPPVYILMFVFLSLQMAAWLTSEINLYRQRQGLKPLWTVILKRRNSK